MHWLLHPHKPNSNSHNTNVSISIVVQVRWTRKKIVLDIEQQEQTNKKDERKATYAHINILISSAKEYYDMHLCVYNNSFDALWWIHLCVCQIGDPFSFSSFGYIKYSHFIRSLRVLLQVWCINKNYNK